MTQVDALGCLGNTIKVAAGHYVNLAAPDPATIDIRSIAAALSKVCRFGGHCPQFYSVAEHSVLAARLARSDGFPVEAVRAVLLHDAAEAYIGDLVKPLKIMLPAYREVERRLEAAIATAFGLQAERWADVVKAFDRVMLKAEKLVS